MDFQANRDDCSLRAFSEARRGILPVVKNHFISLLFINLSPYLDKPHEGINGTDPVQVEATQSGEGISFVVAKEAQLLGGSP